MELIFGPEEAHGVPEAHQGSPWLPTRVGGTPTPLGRAPLPRGQPGGPPTYFFHPYIPTYPKTIEEQNRSGVPPPQASVATKTQSGPYSGTLPEGVTLTGGHLHHPGALLDEEGVVHPRG